MSDQEMQFADPDWEPTQSRQKPAGTQQSPSYPPQPVNYDRRERFQQPAVETPPGQAEIYGGYAGPQPDKLRQAPFQYPQMPYRRRGRHRAWLWIIIAILFFGLVSGGVSSLGSIGQKTVTEAIPITNLGPGIATIVINDTNGNIQVNRGGILGIEEVKHSSFFDDPNKSNVKVDESGHTITVNVDTGASPFSSRSVDLNIIVPENVNLQLQTTSGDINVNNTSGSMSLTTTSGNISTENDTFTGNATLNTTSGDIRSTRDEFINDANLTATSGDISMNQDTLLASAKVSDTSGNIDFNGTLATSNVSTTSYQFITVSGDIHIGLPSTSNFTVQADTTSGSIDAGDFPSINVQDTNQGGSQASGSVGTAPGPSLTLNTTSGDISIHQR